MAKDGLINCKKCGTLFFKNSGREICEECFKKELEVIDKIKDVILNSTKQKMTLEEISKESAVNMEELTDLVARSRLFVVLPKISIKCRFCGAELQDDEKIGFTCKKCLLKFSPQMNELEKKGINTEYNTKAKNLKRRLRGGINSVDNQKRYGFIQNYCL